ncbi:glycosyltransferase [Pelagibacterales bacterium]|nr:glycosyltransferase [Pelagibacterales bacterium]
MANILVNLMTWNTGGGIGSKLSYLKAFNSLKKNHNKFYIIISNPSEDIVAAHPNLQFVNNLISPNSLLEKVFFYENKIANISKSLNIDLILNFGDIPARAPIKQLFYFDWPYAVYNNLSLWLRFKPKEIISKLAKRLYFFLTIDRCNSFIVQTNTMKNRLRSIHKKNNIYVVDVGFDEIEAKNYQSNDVVINETPTLIYPTAMYPHKNMHILIDVAKILKLQNFKLKFELTIDSLSGSSEANFCKKILKAGLEDYFVFLGRLDRSALLEKIKNSTAVIMPTLIETYGLPYLEAQYLRKPMFTSRRDFSEEVCGNSAFYFDPLNPDDIVKVIVNNIHNKDKLLNKLLDSDKLLNKRITWQKSTDNVNNIINLMLIN